MEQISVGRIAFAPLASPQAEVARVEIRHHLRPMESARGLRLIAAAGVVSISQFTLVCPFGLFDLVQ